MGRVQNKVALTTGAARGQGRSHAIRLAQEGADIIALDICADVATVPYPVARPEDLEETLRLVEKEDRKILARQLGVRDLAGLTDVVALAMEEFRRIDVVVANAGLSSMRPLLEQSETEWQDMVDILLTGA